MLTISSPNSLIEPQRRFFASGSSKNLDFRLEQLRKLKAAVAEYKEEALAALKADLSKPEFEGYFDLIAINQEIDCAVKHLKSWAKPKKVATPLEQFPATAKIYPEP